MSTKKTTTVDGNQAATSVAYRCSEVIAIYPITPASPMGELSEEWSVAERPNLWGDVPTVQQMHSEAGAAGTVHGALQAGALSTTFTASQGLLLMIPNMYKIAGELTPFVMHVAARTLATHALSIFGDHQDVMACRGTGFAMLCSATPQEAHDFAAVSHAATLRTRVPFLHFFDGFRTSHEITKLEELSDDELLALLPEEAIDEHRIRALSPDHPVLRGSAQNPDVFFQAREACNPFYDRSPDIVADTFRQLGELTGRHYRPYEYFGHPEATRVIVLMGSGVITARALVEHRVAQGERIGVVAVRMFRPFSLQAFAAELPPTLESLAVLDRTKDPGASAEPLFQEVAAALLVSPLRPRVVGGRFGLSSKEFTPAMVQAVFDNLARPEPLHGFTVGIVDDVTRRSLPVGPEPDVLPEGTLQAVFYGLGSDGTVGANKNSIKIIGEHSNLKVQGHFVYDSKKSGAMTISHLRVGQGAIAVPYLVQNADFVACHEPSFVSRIDLLANIKEGGVFLVHSQLPSDRVFASLPSELQERIIERRVRLFAIPALEVAREAGVGKRINTIMQTCFFHLVDLLDGEIATAAIKKAIVASYSKKGDEVVQANLRAVDLALEHLVAVPVPPAPTSTEHRRPAVPVEAPEFVQRITALMLANEGDRLPVSAFAPDGTWPMGTSRWEKRDIADRLPEWEKELCIQCNKCVLACPHAAIRAKIFDPSLLEGAPRGFEHLTFKSPDYRDQAYTLQLSPDDCTGCQLCVAACPAKDKKDKTKTALFMVDKVGKGDEERKKYAFFSEILPELSPSPTRMDVKHVQLKQPLFEFSGACSGCGQTPYVKLLTQLLGDRLLVANATGCSSIYGGNLPTTPYTTNAEGRGPAWSNSLFEDNAEYGLGFRLAIDHLGHQARRLVGNLRPQFDAEGRALVDAILTAEQHSERDIELQRERVAALKLRLSDLSAPQDRLHRLIDYLVKKSVWIVGGDGWAYDIGYGGLDHILSQPHDVNVLVMDTGAYSNTGGQQSKATPLGASAKFAQSGKETSRKDLARIAMAYPHVYVAQVAFGARDQHTLRALDEAAKHPGPSLVIAYAHCIAHGCDMTSGLEQQQLAVDTGFWPLFRSDPRRVSEGQAPLQLDFGHKPKKPVREFAARENRFRTVARYGQERFERLAEAMQTEVDERTKQLRDLQRTQEDDARLRQDAASKDDATPGE